MQTAHVTNHSVPGGFVDPRRFAYNGGLGTGSYKMSHLRSIVQTLKTLAAAAGCWMALHGTVLAKAKKVKEETGGSPSWLLPYSLILFAVVLGMLVVCRSSRRKDRAKPETYSGADAELKRE